MHQRSNLTVCTVECRGWAYDLVSTGKLKLSYNCLGFGHISIPIFNPHSKYENLLTLIGTNEKICKVVGKKKIVMKRQLFDLSVCSMNAGAPVIPSTIKFPSPDINSF